MGKRKRGRRALFPFPPRCQSQRTWGLFLVSTRVRRPAVRMMERTRTLIIGACVSPDAGMRATACVKR